MLFSSYEYYDLYNIDIVDEDIISASCHYYDKGLIWNLLILFNFLVMFVIPFGVRFLLYVSMCCHCVMMLFSRL